MSISPTSTQDLDVHVEEWEIRYRKLEESLLLRENDQTTNDNRKQSNDGINTPNYHHHDHYEESFVAQSMITMAGRLGSLQLQATDSMGQAMCDYVQNELLRGDAIQRRQDVILQKMASKITTRGSVVAIHDGGNGNGSSNYTTTTYPSPSTCDVDAFFEEYPECAQCQDYDTSWNDDDESSDDDNDDNENEKESRGNNNHRIEPKAMSSKEPTSKKLKTRVEDVVVTEGEKDQPSSSFHERPMSARGRKSMETVPPPPSSSSSSMMTASNMSRASNNPYQNVARSKLPSSSLQQEHHRQQQQQQQRQPQFHYPPPPQTAAVGAATSSAWDNHDAGADLPMNRNSNHSKHSQHRQPSHHQPLSSTADRSSAPHHPQGSTSRVGPFHQKTSHGRSDPWEDSQISRASHPSVPGFCSAKELAQGGMVGNSKDSTSWDHHSPSPREIRTTVTTSSRSTSNDYCYSYVPPPESGIPPNDVQPRQGGGPSIPDSLRRKFQPPKRIGDHESNNGSNSSGGRQRRPSSFAPSKGGGVQTTRPSSSSGNQEKEEEDELPEELQHLEKELVRKIQNEIMESGETITFDDIAGLEDAKQTVQEVVCWPMKRPDLFTGLRRAPNGLLLYGPPGTGKTLIGKAIAHESGATFFSISSSSMTSKWIGEGEKLVKTLFAVAAYREPAVVFIDEIDSLLTQRKATENEASRRMKTEFLVQLDGTGTSGQGRVLVIGATNKPQELDEAARRRFTKRLYIPLPSTDDRRILLHVMLKKNNHQLTDQDIESLARDTAGFSGADLKSLCTDAAMGPIRQLGPRALDVAVQDVPAITYKHFKRSLKGTKPSVAPSDLVEYEEWDKIYGSKRATEEEDDDDEE